MRTVRVLPADSDGDDLEVDADVDPGDRYVLLKASEDAWLVRNPQTGQRHHVPADRLERVGDPPLVAAAESVASPVRRVLAAVHDERTLGLLVELVDRAIQDEGDSRRATHVRTLLEATALCESDLHGALAELEAAELLIRVEADSRGGGRGYRPTDAAVEAVERLRVA